MDNGYKEIDISKENLESIYVILNSFNRLEFRAYKEQTVKRRISRRINMVNCSSAAEYLNYLEQNSGEIEALFNDLLIEVTNFFRDAEAFDILQLKIIPELLDLQKEELRIWVSACATGQEAYSIAILLYEALKQAGKKKSFRIFATDISDEAISFAASGIFTRESLEASLPPHYVEKYFYAVDEKRCRIHPRIRSKISFFKHNVLSDPPFPYIDLLSCRNLLIYFTPEYQKQVLATFHFALNETGYLFLGSSESLNEMSHGFHTIDARWRIFSKNSQIKLPFEAHRLKPEPINLEKFAASLVTIATNQRGGLTEIYDGLIGNFMAPGIVVDAQNEIIHINGEVMKYFPSVKGRLSSQLLDWADGELRIAVASAISRCSRLHLKITVANVPVQASGFTGNVTVSVSPFKVTGENYFFVQVGPVPETASNPGEESVFNIQADAQERIENLEAEVRELQKSLYSAIEERKSSQEELQASNEELRASNEELQSSNEELQAITSENEKKLRELAALNNDINNLLKSTDIAAVFLDEELCIRRFTHEAEIFLGLSLRDIGRPVVNIRSELIDFASIENDSKKSLQSGSTVEKEIVLSGGRSFIYRLLPFRDETDQIRGVVLTYNETTSLREVQTAYSASEARYRAAVEAVDDAVWSYDAVSDRFECSDRWYSMFGVSRSLEKIGIDDLCGFLLPEDQERFRNSFNKIVQFGEPFDVEFRVCNGDKKACKWIVSRGRFIERNADDVASIIMGTCSDVTLRKQLETLHHQQDALLANLISNMPLAIMAKNPDDDFRYTLCNAAAERLFDRRADDIIGKRVHDLYPAEDAWRYAEQDRLIMLQRRVVDLGEQTMTMGGNIRDVRMVKVPVFGAENKVSLIFVLLEDVTEARSLERQLNHSQKMDAVGRLAGGIAHDFNNMLQAIIGYGSLLSEALAGHQENRESADLILRAAHQASGLVRQLMAFSRREELVRRQVEAVSLVKEMVKMLNRLIGEHIAIKVVSIPEEAWVLADPGNIEQAMINLCINARDAMSDGGQLVLSVQKLQISENLTIGMHIIPPGNYVSIKVTDNGRGIPARYMDHIFEPFFTTKELGKGTGLGLATVYAIVSRHEGYVTVESVDGKGSEFTVFLPECPAPGLVTPVYEQVTSDNGGIETILLAEDEPMVRNYAATILKRAGYKVLMAVDGRDAVDIFTEKKDEIHMLVFDVMMPRMNGRQAFEEIKKLNPTIPVLFCSGYGDDLLKNEYMVEIDGRLLPKPYRSGDLLREIRSLLGN